MIAHCACHAGGLTNDTRKPAVEDLDVAFRVLGGQRPIVDGAWELRRPKRLQKGRLRFEQETASEEAERLRWLLSAKKPPRMSGGYG